MAINFIKILSLLLFSTSVFAWEEDEEDKFTPEQIQYLEIRNIRLANLAALTTIAKHLKAIRCQGENSDECDNIEPIENEAE